MYNSDGIQIGQPVTTSFTGALTLYGPRSMEVTATPNSAVITWTDINDAVMAVPTYEIQMRVQNDDKSFGTWTPVTSANSALEITGRIHRLTLSKLVAATNYHLSVRAVQEDDVSAWVTIAFYTDGFIRRPAHLLSSVEKSAYVKALKDLGNSNEYHVFTLQHDVALVAPAGRAHRGPIFLPW